MRETIFFVDLHVDLGQIGCKTKHTLIGKDSRLQIMVWTAPDLLLCDVELVCAPCPSPAGDCLLWEQLTAEDEWIEFVLN
jgi:hypothetical protein